MAKRCNYFHFFKLIDVAMTFILSCVCTFHGVTKPYFYHNAMIIITKKKSMFIYCTQFIESCDVLA
jgi:hypothetical protein